jgi:peptidoglycan/LPS O-acetylase OafA/YrhL
MQNPNLQHIPQLDGLRAIAVLMVFCHHALAIPLLWSGVDLFFILSGYLITSILLRDCKRMSFGKMLGSFYLRRAERILPAYILFLLIAYPFVRTEWHHTWGYYVCFLQNVPLALGMVNSSPLTPLWSLAIEQHFYLFWPVLIFFLPNRWLIPSMLFLLIGTPVLRSVCTPLFSHSAYIYALTPFRLDALAAGSLGALILPSCRASVGIRSAQMAMLVGTICYAVLAFHHPWFRRTANSASFNGLSYSLNILILGGLFVWASLSRNSWLTRILSAPMLCWIGRISYSFYLFHLLVLILLQRYMTRGLAAVCGLSITIAISSLSWSLMEKRVLALGASYRRSRSGFISA